jgi:hypothetical protein
MVSGDIVLGNEEHTISVEAIVITIHYSLFWSQVAKCRPTVVTWKVVCRWIIESFHMGHFMNSCRGLSDTMAIPVDEWKLPVEVTVRNLGAKGIADVV